MATKKKRSYKLLPGLYRAAVLALRYDELTLLNAFESLGLSYISQRPTNDWEWYFIAQHYRLPTRLLDWTENILAALYFALDDFWRAIEKGQGTEPPQSSHPQFDGESPSIWMLDGGTMNLFSHGEDTLYATPREELTSYLPRFLAQPITANRLQPDAPIALHPPRQTSRIIAQQGMFTLHGRDQVPLDTLGTGPSGQAVIKLGCITLDRSRLRFLLDELQMAGVKQACLVSGLGVRG